VEINTGSQPIDKILHESVRNMVSSGTPLKISYKVENDLSSIRADRPALQRAFRAILMNCVESREHDLEIDVCAEQRDEMIQITVSDNGEGISPENLRRTRDPFFSTRPKKAGLGLSIADRIIQLHGGNLTIDSQRGVGTTVTVFLPIHQ
jgi:signal transduction histidine kinase